MKERDDLWDCLRRVYAGDGLQCVLVEGAPGSGKTALIEWMASRAHALGVARFMYLTHQESPGPFDGLSGMVRRYFRLQGAPEADQRPLIQNRLGLHTKQIQSSTNCWHSWMSTVHTDKGSKGSSINQPTTKIRSHSTFDSSFVDGSPHHYSGRRYSLVNGDRGVSPVSREAPSGHIPVHFWDSQTERGDVCVPETQDIDGRGILGRQLNWDH